jgi:hypothetical protein
MLLGPHLVPGSAARASGLQMLQERVRGAVLVGVAGVDPALGDLLQALMAPAPNRGDGHFLPDRLLCTAGAKVALASRLGLIDSGVERALDALRKLRKTFAHSAGSATLADPTHGSCLHRSPEEPPLLSSGRRSIGHAAHCLRTSLSRLAGLHPAIYDLGGLPGGGGTAAKAPAACCGHGLCGVQAGHRCQ